MHHGRLSLESESSQKPFVSDKTDQKLALGHQTVPAPRLLRADRRAWFVSPYLLSTTRAFRPEKAPALTASATQFKQRRIYHECHIQGHVTPDCKLPLRELKQVTENYETLSSAEGLAVPPVSHLRAKQVYGPIKQDTQVSAPGPTPQKTSLNYGGKKEAREAAILNYLNVRQSLPTQNPNDPFKEASPLKTELL